MTDTIRRGKIIEIDILTDPEHLRQIDMAVFDDWRWVRQGFVRSSQYGGLSV